MKRVLVIGNAPLPNDKAKSRPAAGLRTWQFVKPLVDNGVSVMLACIAMPECYEKEPEYSRHEREKNFLQVTISKNDSALSEKLQKICDEFKPDAVIGVNTYPSYIASGLKFGKPMKNASCRVNFVASSSPYKLVRLFRKLLVSLQSIVFHRFPNVPFWADLNGWIMAEAQAQAHKMQSNDYLSHYYKMEKSVLLRADKISTVSLAQKFAVLGELAFLGRLGKESFGYEFVEHIPNGTEDFGDDLTDGIQVLAKIPEDAFVALWVGGYNTWADEEMLFKGLIGAMEKCEKLYFVSTGGEIEGLDNKTFSHFKEMIEESMYKDRFIFLGWVDSHYIPYIYSRAHVGLNVDRPCVETFTGARNRINEMMKYGLPVITTLGSEISYETVMADCGVGIKHGDYAGLGNLLARVYEEWVGGIDFARGKNGVKYIEGKCSYNFLMKSFISWCLSPSVSPFGYYKLAGWFGFLIGAFRYLKENGVRKSLKKIFGR